MEKTKIKSGDFIYSAAAIQTERSQLSTGRLLLVLHTDNAGNIKAAPVVRKKAGYPQAHPIPGQAILGVRMNDCDLVLDINVQLPSSWPVLKQAMRLEAGALQQALDAKDHYRQQGKPLKNIKAPEQSAHQHQQRPDSALWEQTKVLYETFKADPALLPEYLVFSAKFYQYSARNQALIFAQNEHATFLASKTNWAKMGYEVLPEQTQKAVKIRRPDMVKVFNRNGHSVLVSKATLQEKKWIESGQLQVHEKLVFSPMRTYDISQTTCPVEDYPKVYNKGVADPAHAALFEATKRVAELEGIAVSVEDVTSIALGGYFVPATNSIVVSDKEQDTNKALVMLHEYAHALLHNAQAVDKPKETAIKEFEAQGLAITLMEHYACPISENDKQMLVQHLQEAIVQHPDFAIEKSLEKMNKAFGHASERIGQQLGILQEKQLEQVQKQQTVSVQMPRPAAPVQENFLQSL